MGIIKECSKVIFGLLSPHDVYYIFFLYLGFHLVVFTVGKVALISPSVGKADCSSCVKTNTHTKDIGREKSSKMEAGRGKKDIPRKTGEEAENESKPLI